MDGETAEERPHAKISPSALKHFAECPGYQPRDGSSEASERGNRIHWALETDDASQLHDDDEIEMYEKCKRDRIRLIEDLKERAGGEEPVVFLEERFHMDLGCTETFGTGDVFAMSGRLGLLADYKTGVGAIDPPPDNLQSTAYIIGAFQAFPHLDEIHAAFICPDYSVEPLEGTYYRSELSTYIKRVARIILMGEIVGDKWTDDGGSPSMHELRPCDSCIWCRNQDRCPALGYIAVDVAKKYAPDLLPGDWSVRFDDIDDPAEIAKLYKVYSILGKAAESFRYKAVRAASESGIEYPGLRLKSMGSPREVTDVGALQQVAAENGISQEELMGAAKFSLASLAEIVKNRAPRGKKSSMVQAFEDQMEIVGATTRKDERFTLVSTKADDDE